MLKLLYVQAQVLRQELGRTFGTKKMRKAIASQTENAINRAREEEEEEAEMDPSSPSKGRGVPPSSTVDPVMAALLESMDAIAADTSTREELQAASDEAKPRPKANLTATKVEDVYPLHELIGEETMRLLVVKEWQDAAAASASNKSQAMTVKSRYVGQRMAKLARASIMTSGSNGSEDDNEEEREERDKSLIKLQVLRYILLLLDFLAALRSTGRKSSKRLPERDELRRATGVQDFLIETLRKRFADGG